MWRKRLSLLMVVLVTLSLLTFVTGCSSKETAEPAPAPQVQEVDEEAIIQEAAINYFNLSVNVIAAADVSEKLADFHVIDIRKPEDYAKGHVPGAENIVMAKMGEAIPTLPTDKPLLVYCYTGQTAGQTIAVLRMAGFDTYSLKGGFVNGWSNDPALPVEQ